MQVAIRAHIKDQDPSTKHRLPWIVYATELGYLYDGDRYWPEFEQSTPGWTKQKYRPWLRRCFFHFHETYGGVHPSGSWASHFSIISWPITHAILPHDLQRQLAQILYNLRFSFKAAYFDEPQRLGERIALLSANPTSRFQKFVEQPALVGQIAAALLLPEQAQGAYLHTATLARIVEDLERERANRSWLRDAQRTAQGIHLSGLTKRRGEGRDSSRSGHAAASNGEPAPSASAALGIEPRLLLRPTGEHRWEARVELPDFTHLQQRYPQMADMLNRARYRVSGSNGRPYPARQLLYSKRTVALQQWPDQGTLLLTFEPSTRELNYLLKNECTLRPGPYWLFRIASDGLAQEVRGKTVRPGKSYLLLGRSHSFQAHDVGTPIELACNGVRGVMLEVPDALSPAWQQALENWGLQQARKIEVWPVGLPPADWDDEGQVAWLTSDPAFVGIRADFTVDQFALQLDEQKDERLTVQPSAPGQAVLVELPSLTPGKHHLHVIAQAEGEEEAQGVLHILARDPLPWSSEVSIQRPFRITIEPPVVTLESLWRGELDLVGQGPPGSKVRVAMCFWDHEGTRLYDEGLHRITLPLDPDAWRAYFTQHVKGREKITERVYDQAQACEVRFDGAELGRFAFRFERKAVPLRWILRARSQEFHLTLMDDTSLEDRLSVHRYTYSVPDQAIPIDESQARDGFQTHEEGGLFVARTGTYEAAILIPARFTNLAELQRLQNLQPTLGSLPRSNSGIRSALSVCRCWSSARQPGNPFVQKMLGDTLRSVTQQIVAVICGERWKRTEQAFHNKEVTLGALAKETERDCRQVLSWLQNNTASLHTLPLEERLDHLKRIARKHLHIPIKGVLPRAGNYQEWVADLGPGHPHWLSECALRLASAPSTVEPWAGEHLEEGLKKIFDNPALLRIARFFVLAVDAHLPDDVLSDRSLYKGWRWP